jgi:hypothetical protein
MQIVAVTLEMHFTLQGFMLEDVIFRDMKVLGGLIHNWDYYVYYVILFPALIAIQYSHHGELVYRHESYSELTSIDNIS